MNTANLQIEGLHAAVQSVLCALREKQILTADEIDRALAGAESVAGADPRRPTELSDPLSAGRQPALRRRPAADLQRSRDAGRTREQARQLTPP